jgi:hypothetical protein
MEVRQPLTLAAVVRRAVRAKKLWTNTQGVGTSRLMLCWHMLCIGALSGGRPGA